MLEGRCPAVHFLPTCKECLFQGFHRLLPRKALVLKGPEPRTTGWVWDLEDTATTSARLPAPMAWAPRDRPQAPSAFLHSALPPAGCLGWGAQWRCCGTDGTPCHAFLCLVKLVPERRLAQGLPSDWFSPMQREGGVRCAFCSIPRYLPAAGVGLGLRVITWRKGAHRPRISALDSSVPKKWTFFLW